MPSQEVRRRNWDRVVALCRWLVGVFCATVAVRAETPVLFLSAPGQFEIASTDVAAARTVGSEAADAWRTLAEPLGLPTGFSTPVLVRLIPMAEWRDAAAFRVTAEPGGVVSARIGWRSAADVEVVRRALVQSLLLRLAVTQHGVHSRLDVPLWLEFACVGWWRTRADPAQGDAWRQAAAKLSPVSLEVLLRWRRGDEEPAAKVAGALGLMQLLHSDGAHGEWPAFLRRVLGGENAISALASTYPGRLGNETERELWWQTGWHSLRRVRTLPMLDPEESRIALEALARFVFAVGGRDQVFSLRETLRRSAEPASAAAVRDHARELERVVGQLHPFYRNAGLSLAAAFSATASSPAKQEAACAAFEADWRDATELQTATAAALDALESTPR